MIPVLEINNLSYSYHSLDGETKVLKDINLTVNEGDFISVVGPSGCGKSTLLSLICGLIKPESGEIKIHGQKLDKSSSKIGYMLQKDHLFEWRTIYSNIMLGLEIQKKNTPDTRENAGKLLYEYGLDNFRDKKPSELSGGMRQRAALIRTLVLEPEILLLDEPFSALDYQTRLEVCNDINYIIRKEKSTAILVTHDISEAISMGDYVVVLSNRPAVIKKIIKTDFNMTDRNPLKVRGTKEFQDYFNQIWKELS